jgi:hypothetical protein
VSTRSRLLSFAAAALALLAAPTAASAAIVTNGDFETGDLSGWTQSSSPEGIWEVYSGTMTPTFGDPIQAPPQGTHAATTEQGDPSYMAIHQDVTLPPVGSQIQLALFAYYNSAGAIISPDDFLSSPSQQYRIDVMKPSAPDDSTAPGDILATVFRTKTGDTVTLPPTRETADLTALAGQTVRIRLVVVVTENELNAGADAIAVNGLTLGKSKPNKKNGTAKLPVTVTGPGIVSLTGKGVKRRSARASEAVATDGGTTKLIVKPKGKTRNKLNGSGKAKVKVTVTYTPTGGSPISDGEKVKLKQA